MIKAQLIIRRFPRIQCLCLRLRADRKPAALHTANRIDIGVSRRHIRIHRDQRICRNLLRECNLLLGRQGHSAVFFHMEQLELCLCPLFYRFHIELQGLQVRMLRDEIFAGILLLTDRLRNTGG